MSYLDLPIRAAKEAVTTHGISPDRCDILQDGSTLVLRLTDDLVVRVVQDNDGPRQGIDWFSRENAIAHHLTTHHAPTIPLHPDLPKTPIEHLGYSMNFWKFVTAIEETPAAKEIGETLRQCHKILRNFRGDLPKLGIISESLGLLGSLREKNLFLEETLTLLDQHLRNSLTALDSAPSQPLHGDAHLGNFMNTTSGLLLTDWEDAFLGPVEWDLASVIWNAHVHENDQIYVDAFFAAYGDFDQKILHQCMIARCAVMTTWYPLLYPNMNAERSEKLAKRIDWLRLV